MITLHSKCERSGEVFCILWGTKAPQHEGFHKAMCMKFTRKPPGARPPTKQEVRHFGFIILFWRHFCCFTKTSWRFECVVPFKLNLGDEERVLMLRHGTRLKDAQASQSLETRNQDYLIETSVDARLPWDLLPETPHLQISCFILWRSSGSTLSSFLTWSCSSTLFWWLGGCNSPPRRFALGGKPPQWIISDLVKVLVWCWHWIISVFVPVMTRIDFGCRACFEETKVTFDSTSCRPWLGCHFSVRTAAENHCPLLWKRRSTKKQSSNIIPICRIKFNLKPLRVLSRCYFCATLI